MDGADNTVLGTTVGAVNGAACTTDFVVIANPIVVSTGVSAGTDRFCGLGFVPVQSKLYLYQTLLFLKSNFDFLIFTF